MPSALKGTHRLSFRQALHGVLENVWWRIALPRWVYKLPFCTFFKHVDASFKEFGCYLEEMVKERREHGQIAAGRREADLLGALLQASAGAEGRADCPQQP